MAKSIQEDYKTLVDFWNQNFALEEEEKKQLEETSNDDSWKELPPSAKLFDVLTSFKGKEHVLDYGCGSGWGSLVMAKSGVSRITAVDVANNSLEMLRCYAKAYGVDQQIEGIVIDEAWLSKQPKGVYDGLFCSNVIDVVPLEMAKRIVEECARVVQEGAFVVFSLNYFIEPEKMAERGAKIDGPHIYLNGVLRLLSLTDLEWKNLFECFFKDVSLAYFSWPGEAKETRRLFTMKK